MGVSVCAVIAGTVLIVNVILTVWAMNKFGVEEGIGTIQDELCKDTADLSLTKDLSLWLHLVINALSTLLLSASNYCMQCLSSPTREEINNAHAQSIWLDIGVPSVRHLSDLPYLIPSLKYKVTLPERIAAPSPKPAPEARSASQWSS